jgi:hypothetical protein
MPAIRTVTGIDDDQAALAYLQGWQRPDRSVVSLDASDLAGGSFPGHRNRRPG